MVARLDSTYGYLQKLAGNFGTPSGQLALRMATLYPELTLEELLSPGKKKPAKRGPAKHRPRGRKNT